jgi:hypothetical protein
MSQKIENLKVQKPIQKDSAILKLDPFIDSEGVLRVGGRLKLSNLSLGQKHHPGSSLSTHNCLPACFDRQS